MGVRRDALDHRADVGEELGNELVLERLVAVPVPRVPVEVLSLFCGLEEVMASGDYLIGSLDALRALDMQRVFPDRTAFNCAHCAEVEHPHVYSAIRGRQTESREQIKVFPCCISYVCHCP